MHTSRAVLLAAGLIVAGCGPAPLTGKVDVIGGTSGGVLVLAYGAVSVATVTDDQGAFTLSGLTDGDYVLKAAVRGSEEKELQLSMKVKGGKATPEPALTFHMPNAKVTGHVVFADGSDAANLVVNLTGDSNRSTTTSAGGTFSFDGVPAGGYVVTVEVASTAEGRVAVGVGLSSGQAVDLGALELTPVGLVQGVVNQGATPVEGVQVAVAGTEHAAVSDALGRFTLASVPAGDRTVVASKGAGVTLVAATQAVTVVRGKNPALTLNLAAVPPKTGTVTGTVAFNGMQTPTVITLSVPGTAVTGAPAVDGNYSLAVPAGSWDVVASAPNFPKQTLGRVVVQEGVVTTVKPSMMSWYVPFYVENTVFSSAGGLASCAGGPWAALSVTAGSDQRLVFVNTKTLERRQVASGSVSGLVFSSKCKYASFRLNNFLMVYEVGTANLQAWGAGATAPMDFSTDESTLFVTRNGSTLTPPPLGTNTGLERINLGTGTSTGFPSAAGGVQEQNGDRFFVLEAANSARLVTPTSDAVVFTAVKAGTLNVSPTAWALTACTAGVSCSLKVLSPTGTTPNSVAGVWDTASVLPGSTGDWIGFLVTAAAAIPPSAWKLVRASDATSVTLPLNTTALWLNSDGTRIAYHTFGGAIRWLREEPLPATGTVAPFATSTVDIVPNWLSNTRLVAYDPAPVNKVYEVKSGVLSTDSDVAAPTGSALFCTSGSVAAYAQASTAKWKVLFADAAPLVVDGPNVSGTNSVACGARALVAGQPAPTWGFFAIDEDTTFVVDGAGNQVRRQFVGRASSGFAMASEGVDFFYVQGLGTAPSWYLPASGQLIQWSEPGRSLVSLGLDPVGGFFSIARDTGFQTLFVGRFWR